MNGPSEHRWHRAITSSLWAYGLSCLALKEMLFLHVHLPTRPKRPRFGWDHYGIRLDGEIYQGHVYLVMIIVDARKRKGVMLYHFRQRQELPKKVFYFMKYVRVSSKIDSKHFSWGIHPSGGLPACYVLYSQSWVYRSFSDLPAYEFRNQSARLQQNKKVRQAPNIPMSNAQVG